MAANSSSVTKSFIGRGPLFMRDLADTDTAREIGNASQFDLTFTEERVTQRDYQSPGGGNADLLSRVSAVTGTVNGFSFSAEVMKAILRANIVETTVAAATTDVFANVQVLDGAYFASTLMDPTAARSVTINGGAVLVEGTDYTWLNNGFKLINSGAVTAGDQLDLAYQSQVGFSAAPLTEAQPRYEITFDGFNEANSNKPVFIQILCAAVDVAQVINWISGDTDFGNLTWTFEALKDVSVTTTGLSQYAVIRMSS